MYARCIHLNGEGLEAAGDLLESMLRRAGVARGTVLSAGVGIPVPVDNDANPGALAQVTWGPHSAVENLAFIP